jgi:hypothetical protein
MGPVMLITVGVLFLIDQYTMYGINQTWPILLIVIGLVKLVQWNAPTTGHVDVSQIGPGGPPPGAPGPGGGAASLPDGQQVSHG